MLITSKMDQSDSKSKHFGDSEKAGSLLPSFSGRYGTTVIRRSLLFLRLNKELMTLQSSVKNVFLSSIGWLIFALWTMTNDGRVSRLTLRAVDPLRRRLLKVSELRVKSPAVEPTLLCSMTLRFPLTLLPTSCVKNFCSWLLRASPSLPQRKTVVSCFSVRHKLLLQFIVH